MHESPRNRVLIRWICGINQRRCDLTVVSRNNWGTPNSFYQVASGLFAYLK